jgi:cyanate permease
MWLNGLTLGFVFKEDFTWVDWILVTGFSIGTVIAQTLKFVALQYDKPGKLSHY